MSIKDLLLTTLLVLLTPSLLLAGEREAYFNKGNSAYRSGDYTSALKLYRQAEVKNGLLYYNMANSYLKNGEIGMAILYYNRALKLHPRDKEIKNNLKRARMFRKESIDKGDAIQLPAIMQLHYPYLSMNEHAVLLLILLTLSSISIFIFYNVSGRPKTRYWAKQSSLILSIILVLQLTVTTVKSYKEEGRGKGVIVKSELSAFSEPSAASDKVFQLHDGAEVTIQMKEKGFLKVMLPTGWTGWVPASSVEII